MLQLNGTLLHFPTLQEAQKMSCGGGFLPPLVLPQGCNLLEWEDPSRDGLRVIGDCVVVLRNPVEVRSVVCFLSSLELNSRCCDDGGDGEGVVSGSDCTKELESVKRNQELKKDWTYHFISECLSEGIVLLIPLLRPPLNCLDHPVSRDLQKLRGIGQGELGHSWDDFCCGGRHV